MKEDQSNRPVAVDLGVCPASILRETLEIVDFKKYGVTSAGTDLLLQASKAVIKVREAQAALNDLITAQNAYIDSEITPTPTEDSPQ